MAKRKRRKKQYKWNSSQIGQLVDGHDFFHDGFGRLETEEQIEDFKRCWNENQQMVMYHWLEQCPGHRPYAWWHSRGVDAIPGRYNENHSSQAAYLDKHDLWENGERERYLEIENQPEPECDKYGSQKHYHWENRWSLAERNVREVLQAGFPL